MESELIIKNGITIPTSELEITFSRSGGPGGQHVNKTETRVTVMWNVYTSNALTEEQKNRIIGNLGSRITSDGNLVVHNNESRSQQKNKELAFMNFAKLISKALYVPKKRMKTRLSKAAKEARLEEKSRHSTVKKMRSKKFTDFD